MTSLSCGFNLAPARVVVYHCMLPAILVNGKFVNRTLQTSTASINNKQCHSNVIKQDLHIQQPNQIPKFASIIN